MVEALKIRRENAKLLGFENHAAFQLDVKMAKSESNVWKVFYNLYFYIIISYSVLVAKFFENKIITAWEARTLHSFRFETKRKGRIKRRI